MIRKTAKFSSLKSQLLTMEVQSHLSYVYLLCYFHLEYVYHATKDYGKIDEIMNNSCNLLHSKKVNIDNL